MRLIAVLFWIRLVVDFKLLRDKLFERFSRGVIGYYRSLFFLLLLWRLFENGFEVILKHRDRCLMKFTNKKPLSWNTSDWSRWPCDLRRGFVATWLLQIQVRIPPEACLSVVSVVFYQVEVFATGWSLVQRSRIDSVCVCVCVREREREREIECDQVEQ